VPLRFAASGWELDLDLLLSKLDSKTKALYVNSPNNPTGWTMSRRDQQAVLDHCRKHGIWIFADDAYERIHFGEGRAAPSFLDLCDPRDRLVSSNTFSKTWLMPGWRLGWLVVPPALAADLAKLVEFNTSCAPVFVQRAGIAAVKEGEPVIARTLGRFRQARDFLVRELNATEGVQAPLPGGTMYAFFRVEGVRDSLDFCKRLVHEAGLGLAPGAAFGPEGEGYLRWCFASGIERLEEGIGRLRRALVHHRK
jgi:aspartate/methionine/tyrosine aminotransferase